MKLPIKTLIVDNGKEFHNKKLEKWCHEKGIKLEYSVPHYHQSNGRIERANRTIREALKKTKGCTRLVLNGILETYINVDHRGIGMTPIEAILPQNYKFVTDRHGA